MPDPATYPLSTICKLLDLSERRIQQLAREGVIPKSERGRYELVPAVQGYIHYLRDRSLDVGVVSIDIARQRKTAAEAEMAEMELAKARAEVVCIEDVAKQWDQILSGVRTRMLALPTKLAAIATAETDQKIVKELITDGIHTALGELARGLRDSTGSTVELGKSTRKNPSKNGSTAKTNNKRVGGQGKKAKSGS